MDTASDRPDPLPASDTGRRGRLPGAWLALLILLTGAGLTFWQARLAADRANTLAASHLDATHERLVKELLARTLAAPPGPEEPVKRWLSGVFASTLPADVGLRIDTLDRHTKSPLWQRQLPEQPAPERSLRTEVHGPGYHWLVTTAPADPSWAPAQRAQTRAWLAGGVLTVAFAALALILCRWRARLYQTLARRDGANQQLLRQLAALQVEKTVLRQALNDAESRSRDLVALSGALVCELDPDGVIGFVSPQSADLLGQAPADLVGQPFTGHIAQAEGSTTDNFRRTLAAARNSGEIERLDLSLRHADGRTVPVTVRLRATTAVDQALTGYRLTALANPFAQQSG